MGPNVYDKPMEARTQHWRKSKISDSGRRSVHLHFRFFIKALDAWVKMGGPFCVLQTTVAFPHILSRQESKYVIQTAIPFHTRRVDQPKKTKAPFTPEAEHLATGIYANNGTHCG